MIRFRLLALFRSLIALTTGFDFDDFDDGSAPLPFANFVALVACLLERQPDIR